MLLPVVLAGGTGSRLWPVSRRGVPKPFHALAGERTLFQETVVRLQGLETDAPIVVCNEEHRFLAAEQLRTLGREDATILLEPVGRSTAPAVALAALHALGQGGDPLLLVLATDHILRDAEGFRGAVGDAGPLAESGRLVTFGLVPNRPETAYGYIRRGAPLGNGYAVERFVEKPDVQTAGSYVASGEYYWNSGMFLFRASRYLEELRKYSPDILVTCEKAMAEPRIEAPFLRADAEAFKTCPANSIDYAVMEETANAAVVPLGSCWADIGTWAALWENQQRDENENVLHGDVIALSSGGTLVRAEARLVALLGVRDLVVIETADAVLVARRDMAHDVKVLVEQFRKAGRNVY